MYSPSLKGVDWLEDTQLEFSIHWSVIRPAHHVYGAYFTDKCMKN